MCEYCLRGIMGWLPEDVKPTAYIKILNCGHYEVIKIRYEEYLKNKTVVFLIPARTDTKYFHEYLYPYAKLRFIKGRLKFGNGKGSAPFPSMIAILKEESEEK
jgi:hypothetical protein